MKNIEEDWDEGGRYNKYIILYGNKHSIEAISGTDTDDYNLKIGQKVKVKASKVNPNIAIYHNHVEYIKIIAYLLLYIAPYIFLLVLYSNYKFKKEYPNCKDTLPDENNLPTHFV